MLKLPEGTWIYLDLASKRWKNHVSPWKNYGITMGPKTSNGSVAKFSDNHGFLKPPNIPSGELYKKLWKMAIEIVDFPMKNGGSFHCYVSSPEGTDVDCRVPEFPQHQSQLGFFQCRSKWSKWSKCETKIAMIQLHLVKSNIGNAEGKYPNLDQSNCVFSARKSCPMF